jgi:hypothetical protein
MHQQKKKQSYTDIIPPEHFQRETVTYTDKQVNDLLNQIHSDPYIRRNTIHLNRSLLPYTIVESQVLLVFSAISFFVVSLILLSQELDKDKLPSSELTELYMMCKVEILQDYYLTPFYLSCYAILLAFCYWVKWFLSVKLLNEHSRGNMKWLVFKTLLESVMSYITVVFIGLAVLLILDGTRCEEMIDVILVVFNNPVFALIYEGYFFLVHKCFYPMLTGELLVSISFLSMFYFFKLLYRLIKDYKEHTSYIPLIFIACSYLYNIMKMDISISTLSGGELFIMSFYGALVLEEVLSTLYYTYKRNQYKRYYEVSTGDPDDQTRELNDYIRNIERSTNGEEQYNYIDE